MKKKKSSEQSPAGFKTAPFKALKGLTPSPAPKDNKAIPARKRQEEKEEDAQELFLQAVAGARKIPDEPSSDLVPAVKKTPDRSEDAAPHDSQLFLQAMQKIGAVFDEPGEGFEEDETVRRSPSSRMRQLKRGTIRIRQELDLHGLLRDEALRKLERFITDAFNTRQQAVLVITGKGINSPGGPVLQGAVADWLRSNGRGMVAEFSPAPRDKGGSGAYVVFLKQK